MQCVAVQELSKCKYRGNTYNVRVAPAAVCDETLLFNSCYAAGHTDGCTCPQWLRHSECLAGKKMQIIFLPFPLYHATKTCVPQYVTGFVLTSWPICNLKCVYETRMGLALLSGTVPRSTDGAKQAAKVCLQQIVINTLYQNLTAFP